jgi:hypothetical protein
MTIALQWCDYSNHFAFLNDINTYMNFSLEILKFDKNSTRTGSIRGRQKKPQSRFRENIQ